MTNLDLFSELIYHIARSMGTLKNIKYGELRINMGLSEKRETTTSNHLVLL